MQLSGYEKLYYASQIYLWRSVRHTSAKVNVLLVGLCSDNDRDLITGTNDKAGGPHYMLKWASPQSVKQTFVPLKDVAYPYMTKN